MGVKGSNYGGDDRLILVAPSDIATAAAEQLTTSAPAQTVRYAASADHTANEIAATLGAVIGKPDLKWVTFTDEQTQAGMEQNGMAPHLAGMFVELGAAIHTGALRRHYDANKPTTMGQVTLEDFAKEFATAF